MGLIRIVASLFAIAIVANAQANYGGIAGIYNQHPGLKLSHDGQGVQYSFSSDHMVPTAAPKSSAPSSVSFPSTYSSGSSQPAYQPAAYQPASYQPASHQPSSYSQAQPAYQPPAYTPGAAYQTSAPSSYSGDTFSGSLLSKESPIFSTATKLFGDNAAILGPGFQGAAVPSPPQSSGYQPFSGASSPSYYSGAPAVSVAQHNPYQTSSLQGAQQTISPQEALKLHNAQLAAHQAQVHAQEQLINSFAKNYGLGQGSPAPAQGQGQGQQPQQAQYQQYSAPQPQSQSYGYSPQYSSQGSPSYKSSYQA